MLDFKIDVSLPDLTLKTPSRDWWEQTGIDEVRDIRKRADNSEDFEGKRFAAYSPAYYNQLIKDGRPIKANNPNLYNTGKMLGALSKGVRATKSQVKITLSGDEGGKGYRNELNKRIFLAASDDKATKLANEYANWLEKNGL